MTERIWSEQQKQIFKWFEAGKGNLVVRARAGTGKTTTIIEAINYAPETSILLAAFNKKIAEELKTRLKNPAGKAQTLHSVPVSFIFRNWQGTVLNEERAEKLARRAAGPTCPDQVISLIKKLASLAKSSCPFPVVEQMLDLIYNFDLQPDEWMEDQGWYADQVAICAMKAMDLACEKDGTIDFDDMVFVTVRNRWHLPKYDMVVIDEAQDMNASQILLAQGVCKKTGRIVVVGDDRQAIYGFRGADSNSIDRLKSQLKSQELGLTTTYRCGQNIVAEAQRIVPDFHAGPANPQGQVSTMDVEKMAQSATAGDFVLSRKNAPLAKVCMKFLRMRKPARIEGRDIGIGLLAIIRKLRAKSVPDFMEKLSKWEDRQERRLMKTGKETAKKRVEFIHDQAETLRVLAEDVLGVRELESRIDELFTQTGADKSRFILCSSVHKSKGLESDRVFVLKDTLYPGGDRALEEQNIEYVAITRAKSSLVWVPGLG